MVAGKISQRSAEIWNRGVRMDCHSIRSKKRTRGGPETNVAEQPIKTTTLVNRVSSFR
jgi:hypothetical protein